jgi:hypothetical protein
MTPITFTFIDVIPEQFDNVEAQVEQQTGLTLTGNVGEANKFGFDIAYVYDNASTVIFTVKHVPFFSSVDAVKAKLAAAFGKEPS